MRYISSLAESIVLRRKVRDFFHNEGMVVPYLKSNQTGNNVIVMGNSSNILEWRGDRWKGHR